jgi:hypothetical protein
VGLTLAFLTGLVPKTRLISTRIVWRQYCEPILTRLKWIQVLAYCQFKTSYTDTIPQPRFAYRQRKSSRTALVRRRGVHFLRFISKAEILTHFAASVALGSGSQRSAPTWLRPTRAHLPHLDYSPDRSTTFKTLDLAIEFYEQITDLEVTGHLRDQLRTSVRFLVAVKNPPSQ